MLFYLRGRIFLTALPPTPPPQSGRGRLWGNRRFLPHLSEAAALPTATSFQQQPAPPNTRPPEFPDRPTVREGAFVGEPQVPTTLERSGIPARRRLTFIGSQNPNQTKSTQKGAFCAFCLVGLDGLEPSECHSQSVVPYHLATAQYKEKRLFVEVFFLSGVGSGIRTHDLQCHKLTR